MLSHAIHAVMLIDLPDHDTLYIALLARDASYDGQAYVCDGKRTRSGIGREIFQSEW